LASGVPVGDFLALASVERRRAAKFRTLGLASRDTSSAAFADKLAPALATLDDVGDGLALDVVELRRLARRFAVQEKARWRRRVISQD
jgi:hypothetical protein